MSIFQMNQKDPVHQIQQSQNFQNKPSVILGQNIHKTYLFGLEGVAALRGVSVNIRQGEFVIILGNSGGGKTSLLNIIGTIDKPTKGNLQLYNQKIKQKTVDQILSGLRLNHIGFVFQTFNLIESLTAKQNVELPMILKGQLDAQQISRIAQERLNEVGMSHRLKHYPNQLSGGQQQRVTIARALANNPRMLLLDQPTGDLDSRNTVIVLDILLRLNLKGITLVMVTHDVNLKYLSHRVLKVLDGKIINQELIDPRVRKENISQIQEKVRRYEQEKRNFNSLMPSKLEKRKVQSYGPIKWLRQKRIRENIEKEMIEKVRQQLSNLDMNNMAEGVVEKIQELM